MAGFWELIHQLGSDFSEHALEQTLSELSAMIAKKPSLINNLLAPSALCGKPYWDSFARVIAAQSDAVLEHCGVLNWLQDLNWPGSTRLFGRLKAVRPGKLDLAIADCIDFAITVCRDDEWTESLCALQSERMKI